MNNDDLDDSGQGYCISNEFMQMYEDIDGDGFGCGDYSIYCIDNMPGNGWVSNQDDGECECSTNDTDQCGICGGDNDCVGCMDESAFNYEENISIECDNCCIYKYNYPDWDQNNDGVLDNYSDYEFSATFHLTVKNQTNPITSDIVINENDMLAAFSNGEIRGVAKATYNSLLIDDTYLFILMGYSNNQSGDMISFKYYDYESDEVFDLNENIEFISDMSLANALTPYELSVVGSAYPDWTFYYPLYEFNSSLVATLKIGDNYMGYNNQDILSVFINDEPRGALQ